MQQAVLLAVLRVELGAVQQLALGLAWLAWPPTTATLALLLRAQVRVQLQGSRPPSAPGWTAHLKVQTAGREAERALVQSAAAFMACLRLSFRPRSGCRVPWMLRSFSM